MSVPTALTLEMLVATVPISVASAATALMFVALLLTALML